MSSDTVYETEGTPTTPAMSVFGRVPEFNDGSEEFALYLERFQRWLAANDVVNNKKSDILVSTLPARTYTLLRILL